MKILIINSVCGIRSTGRICTDLAVKFENEGHEVKIAYGREAVPAEYDRFALRIASDFSVKLQGIRTRILDDHGFGSKKDTLKFIEWANLYDPDMVWLHNLHGYYINVELLFKWIKSRPKMQVKWTLHDCWAFTGHCAHFVMAQCNKWETQCGNCPQKRNYPASYFVDNSKNNYLRKKELFTGVTNMTVITPSEWLAKLVKKSFLGSYPIEVEYNVVDRNVFKPTVSDFRQRNGLQDKFVILGVASAWSKSKGLEDFVHLSNILNDAYKIVLVGVTEKQRKSLPKKITVLPLTNSTKELAEIYSAADVFVNPSKEETFGLTTVEALYCGTDVIVYKNTACEEIVNKFGGVAVEQNPEAIKRAILERGMA